MINDYVLKKIKRDLIEIVMNSKDSKELFDSLASSLMAIGFFNGDEDIVKYIEENILN